MVLCRLKERLKSSRSSIEPLNKGLAWLQLSLIVFSVSDQAKLAEILEDEKAETFLYGWTRKKPLIKEYGAYF